jgi:hypothetical protein
MGKSRNGVDRVPSRAKTEIGEGPLYHNRNTRRRSYSDEEWATALAALDGNGGNRQRTARQLGIPRKTLATWASGAVHPVVADLRHQKKRELADALEQVACRLLDAIPSKLEGASLLELAISLGILVDKMLLLRGGAAHGRGYTHGGHM